MYFYIFILFGVLFSFLNFYVVSFFFFYLKNLIFLVFFFQKLCLHVTNWQFLYTLKHIYFTIDLMVIFAMCRIWYWQYFLSAIKKSCHFLLVSNVCVEQLTISFFLAFLKVAYFLSDAFDIFSVSVPVFLNLWCQLFCYDICLCKFTLYLSFVVHKTTWVCGLIFSTDLWKLLVIFLQILFLSYIVLSLFLHTLDLFTC